MEELDVSGNRRIDRIKDQDYIDDLGSLELDELRLRRDECRDELDHLSMLRRYIQTRAEVLQAEVRRRRGDNPDASLVDELAVILSGDSDAPRRSLGTAVRLREPDEEMLLARRRSEKLVAEQGVIDPTSLTDDEVSAAVASLEQEERAVSTDRRAAMQVLDVLTDELKRRFKDDPASAIVS